MDNWEISFKAAQCKYLDDELSILSEAEKFSYRQYCVDLYRGDDKPEIRLSQPWTTFNITNKASFYNLVFSGEDLFANATLNGQPFSYMGNYGLLAFLPVKKCKVEDNPDSIGPIDELHLKPMTFVEVAGVNFECVNPFKKKDVIPPNKVDDRCFTPEDKTEPNSATCSGDPYHADFFDYNTQNRYFYKRHKTLFNLYAFDRLRTKNVNSPALTIVNCEFKYFVNSLNSLI